MTTPTSAARDGGEGRAGDILGGRKKFSAHSLGTRFARRVCFPMGRKPPQGAVTFPIPHSPLVLRSLGEGGFPVPQKLGTDPTIGRKIKGLGGFWGGMGSDSVNLPLPTLYRK